MPLPRALGGKLRSLRPSWAHTAVSAASGRAEAEAHGAALPEGHGAWLAAVLSSFLSHFLCVTPQLRPQTVAGPPAPSRLCRCRARAGREGEMERLLSGDPTCSEKGKATRATRASPLQLGAAAAETRLVARSNSSIGQPRRRKRGNSGRAPAARGSAQAGAVQTGPPSPTWAAAGPEAGGCTRMCAGDKHPPPPTGQAAHTPRRAGWLLPLKRLAKDWRDPLSRPWAQLAGRGWRRHHYMSLKLLPRGGKVPQRKGHYAA